MRGQKAQKGNRDAVHVSCTRVIYGQILNEKMRDRFYFNLSWEIEPSNDGFSNIGNYIAWQKEEWVIVNGSLFGPIHKDLTSVDKEGMLHCIAK